MGFPGSSVGKESTCNEGDLDSIPGLGRSPGGHGNPSSVLAWRIPMDRGAWWALVRVVTESRTRLRDYGSDSQVALVAKNLPANTGDA